MNLVEGTIVQVLEEHRYPELLRRVPSLVRVVQLFNVVLILRNWYVRRELQNVVRSLPENALVLDAGCGLGEFVIDSARINPGARVVGADVSGPTIGLGRALADRMKLGNAEFIQADLAQQRPLVDVDVVVCCSVLQSVPKEAEFFRNLFLMLRKGGVLLLYVPVRFRRYLPFFEKLENRHLIRHFYGYSDGFSYHRNTSESIMKKVRQAGFSVEKGIVTYGFFGALAFEMYSLLIVAIKILPVPLLVLAIPAYILGLLPVQIVLMMLDYVLPKQSGNGLMVIARKS